MEFLIGLIIVGVVVFGLGKLLKNKFGKPKLTAAQKEYKIKLANKTNSDRVIGMPAYGLVKKYGQTGIYGEKSEIKAALSLATLPSVFKGLYVFNNVQVTPKWDIDHIVLAGDTIILIDTKNWKGENNYTLRKERNGDIVALRNGQAFQGNSINMEYYVATLRKMYPKFKVVGVMNIDAYGANVTGSSSVGFHFVNFKNLNQKIKEILGSETNKQQASSKTLAAVKSLASKTTQV